MDLPHLDTNANSFTVKEQCPVRSKKFDQIEISDFEGHYDIDGVSFERGLGVIVASDGRTDFKIGFRDMPSLNFLFE